MSNQIKLHFLVYLTGLSIIGFLATDMYLPTFEAIRNDLNTSKTAIGASLTIFLGGFAFGQLIWGPLSDKYGKPRSIVIGLTLFILASLGIYFTENVVLFILLRFFQAIGACAASVCWQALVIEQFDESIAKKVFASIMPLVALSPALAPLLGVFIFEHFGWRAIFVTISLIAFLLIIYSLSLKNKVSNSSTQQSISYSTFFQSKNFIGNVMIYAFCSAGFFAWLTGAPFFLKELGYNESEIGLSFVPQTINFILGGYGIRYLITKIDGKKIVPYLLVLYALSLLIILFLAVFTSPTLTTLLIPFSFMALSNGACYPIVVAEALKPYSANSGKASALQNTIQLGACFIASAAVSAFSNQALLATCIVMTITIVFVAIGYRWSKQ
ncbi:MAG: purine nucleoside transporter PunC [Crocinitomicaceae bacterium]|nr:purine nucleoside transporter PunC [Crocinitomicaceae bacterium]